MARATVIFAAIIGLSGCASNPLGIVRADIPLPYKGMYDSAAIGNKRAQYELGLVFALGPPEMRDCKAARRLLTLASNDSGGTLWVYSPPVGNGTAGRVIPINQGPRRTGLSTARDMLANPEFCNDTERPQ